MAVRYQTLFGTKEQTVEVANIMVQFPKIKATILEQKIVFPRTTPEDKRELHLNELELRGPLKELNKYFEVLDKSSTNFNS